jgi:DNA-binding CsgD family transcriptional regulator
MTLTVAEARAKAGQYRDMMRQRDALILECRAAGLPVSETARLMGISRNLVYDAERRAARRNCAIPSEADRMLAELRERLSGGRPPEALDVPFRAPGSAHF